MFVCVFGFVFSKANAIEYSINQTKNDSFEHRIKYTINHAQIDICWLACVFLLCTKTVGGRFFFTRLYNLEYKGNVKNHHLTHTIRCDDSIASHDGLIGCNTAG